MTIPNEDAMLSSWPKNQPPRVTICCTTFNHVDYVADCIEGFLIQKTDYPFEILIHDDASTDGTSEIINTYQRSYPNILHVIIQEENQYSKGVKVARETIWSEAKGEYIALCEGDDYWADEKKLQKQLNAMIEHEHLDFSFHNYWELNPMGEFSPSRHLDSELKIFDVSEIIRGGGMRFRGYGTLITTASIMVKSKTLKELPEWFNHTPVSDYFIQVIGSVHGALYLPDKMSVYRTLTPGSWSIVFKAKSMKSLDQHFKKMDSSMLSLSSFVGERYKADINYQRCMLFLSGVKNSIRKGSFSSFVYYLFNTMISLIKSFAK